MLMDMENSGIRKMVRDREKTTQKKQQENHYNNNNNINKIYLRNHSKL